MKATATPCVERRRARATAIECRAEPRAAPVRVEVWHEVGTRADKEASVRSACAERLAVLHRRLAVMRRLVEHRRGWTGEAAC